jgi:hypothetical protein
MNILYQTISKKTSFEVFRRAYAWLGRWFVAQTSNEEEENLQQEIRELKLLLDEVHNSTNSTSLRGQDV